jgi:hypothetical protein
VYKVHGAKWAKKPECRLKFRMPPETTVMKSSVAGARTLRRSIFTTISTQGAGDIFALREGDRNLQRETVEYILRPIVTDSLTLGRDQGPGDPESGSVDTSGTVNASRK